MIMNFRGEKVTVTKAIKEYATEKLSKLDKYFENASKIEAHVLIRVKYNLQTIEVTILTNKYTLRAEVSHEDLYAAIDLVTDILERQIRKNKTRLNKQLKDSTIIDFKFDYEVSKEEEDKNKIVKRKNIEMKPMDEEEAILQINLIDHDFFVFKNIDEECVSVIYKRKDESFGIINVK